MHPYIYIRIYIYSCGVAEWFPIGEMVYSQLKSDGSSPAKNLIQVTIIESSWVIVTRPPKKLWVLRLIDRVPGLAESIFKVTFNPGKTFWWMVGSWVLGRPVNVRVLFWDFSPPITLIKKIVNYCFYHVVSTSNAFLFAWYQVRITLIFFCTI